MTVFGSDHVVYGVLDTSAHLGSPAVADFCRDLTVSYTRWGYTGRILCDVDPRRILDEAACGDLGCCLLQPYGHVLAESLRPKGSGPGELWQRLLGQTRAAGAIGATTGPADARFPCMLVDLDRYRMLDTHDRSRHLERGAEGCWTFDGKTPLLQVADEGSAYLDLPRDAHRALLEQLATQRSSPPDPSCLGSEVDPAARRFLEGVEEVLVRCRDAAFVWNIEGYEDIRPSGTGTLDSLYSVAAGFKPNAILEREGFSSRTRVVVYDYSRAALDLKALCVTSWDGRDLPDFLERVVFTRIPPARVHYYLRSMTPDGRWDRDELCELWAREMSDWGGADAFAAHWRRYKSLEHEFVLCDLLQDPAPLLGRVRDERRAVLWWSNAFASVHAIWSFTIEDRLARYGRWLQALAARAPALQVLGSDASNIPVNGLDVASYVAAWRDHRGGALQPLRAYQSMLRF